MHPVEPSDRGSGASRGARAQRVPAFVAPMKAVTSELPPAIEEAAWSYEVKWDGMRIIACTDGAALQLWSGNRIDVTHRFPELASVTAAMGGRAAVLDGEVVAFDIAGLPRFSTLQGRMHIDDPKEALRRAATVPIQYMVFDIVHFDGHDLTSLPFTQRVAVLDELFEEDGAWHRVSRHDNGTDLLDAVRAQRLEGLMAKRRDSPYAPGRRSPSWRKVKVRNHAEFVVGGWLPGAGARSGRLGALLVGYYEDGRLVFAGRVGSGFNDNELDTVAALLADVARDGDPFTPPLRRVDAPGAHFVEPRMVVEVAYADWTNDGRLRHPSYLGRRFDKDPRSITRP